MPASRELCSVIEEGEPCDRVVRCKSLCDKHYQRKRLNGTTDKIRIRRRNLQECSFPGCDDPASAMELCHGHYSQSRDGGELKTKRKHRPRKICKFPGCGRPHGAKGWCTEHRRQELHGKGPMYLIGERPIKGRTIDGNGYARLLVPDHPHAYSNGYALEHYVVMSEMIRRPLLPHENVHHINGVRDDNRPENLELWSHSQPKGQRVHDKSEWAIQILQTYRPDALVSSLRVDATPERK